MEFEHLSVLLDECIQGLNINPDGLYVDCTLGGGGHSAEICRRLSPRGRLVGIDQDMDALKKAGEVLSRFPNAATVSDNFSNIKNIFTEQCLGPADGFLLDLGVSSYQLDEGGRGFSYMQDAALDMRMNKAAEFSAYDVVNGYTQDKLYRIISEYGEERWAKRIAEFILKRREDSPISTTYELVDVIKNAIPKAARSGGPHPAKRTFQAIRIEVNKELEILERAVTDMISLLKPGGRICVITFHSLEDRIIKNTFRLQENPCTCPKDLPVCICKKTPRLRVITRKPVLPGAAELDNNHRSRSAKLRIAERLEEAHERTDKQE